MAVSMETPPSSPKKMQECPAAPVKRSLETVQEELEETDTRSTNAMIFVMEDDGEEVSSK